MRARAWRRKNLVTLNCEEELNEGERKRICVCAREREKESHKLARITMCVLYKIYSLQLFVMDTFYLSNKS